MSTLQDVSLSISNAGTQTDSGRIRPHSKGGVPAPSSDFRMDALTPAGAFFLYLALALVSKVFVAYMVGSDASREFPGARESYNGQESRWTVVSIDDGIL